MADDPYRNFPGSNTQPATNASVVTPSDSVDLAEVPRALVVDGAVKVTTLDGDTVTLPDLGTWQWDLRVVRVHDDGTTATNVVALY